MAVNVYVTKLLALIWRISNATTKLLLIVTILILQLLAAVKLIYVAYASNNATSLHSAKLPKSILESNVSCFLSSTKQIYSPIIRAQLVATRILAQVVAAEFRECK